LHPYKRFLIRAKSHHLLWRRSLNPGSFASTWLLLILGAVLCMWIAERITARGVMDGKALLLTADLIFFPARRINP
jgi:preprotein translocase subunit SecY